MFLEYSQTAVADLALTYAKTDPASNPKKRQDGAWGPWSDRSSKCKWV